MRRINARGLALVKEFEGLSLKAYFCPANVLTIGYGSTGPHVKPGMVITEAEAETLLRKDLARFEAGVNIAIAGVPTSDNELSAMISLSFNIGLAGFQRSTVLKRHNLGNRLGAANAFLMWNKAGGKVLKGLVRRREAERKLYLMPDRVVRVEDLSDADVEAIKAAKPAETPVEPPTAPKAPEPTISVPAPEPAPLGCLAALFGMFR